MLVLACAWAAVAVTVWWLEFTRLHLKLRIGRFQPFNRKPFNCAPCLPVWLFAAFLAFAIYQGRVELVCYVGTAATTGIIAPIMIKKIRQ